MKVLFVGDTHMDVRNWMKVHDLVESLSEIGAIIQLGDFGWWPRKGAFEGLKHQPPSSFKTFLEAVEETAKMAPVCFVPGNHEDWESLEQFVGVAEVATNVRYLPTGSVLDLDGCTFLSAGGAWSIDRRFRVKNVSWFPQEILDETDVKLCAEQGKVDVVISHDSPLSVDLAAVHQSILFGPDSKYEPLGETEVNRGFLQQIVDVAQPNYVFHGHWHFDYSQMIEGGIMVHGLSASFDRPTAFMKMMNTETLKRPYEALS